MTIAATFVVLLVAVFSCCSVAQFVPPEYTYDLEQPPGQRWVAAVKLIDAKHGWDNSFKPVIEMGETLLGYIPPPIVAQLEGLLKRKFPDLWAELTGIHDTAAELGHNFTMDLLTISPFMYELEHASDFIPPQRQWQQQGGETKTMMLSRACTGILSLPQNKSESIVHGRNLDAPPVPSRNLTLHVTVKVAGKYLYETIGGNWFGASAFTASRRGVLTLEQNTRFNPENETARTMAEIVEKFTNGPTMPASQLFRFIHETQFNYDEALDYLMVVNLAAPMFFVMSGPGRRGAVITADYDSTKNVLEQISDKSAVTFIVQTNYDRWKPDPSSDPRRITAEWVLTQEGRYRGGTKFGVWMALGAYPVHNIDTLFTALMRVDEPIEAYIRQAMVPLPPGN